MKKIEQYLLERYPSLWNTKIVWLLGIAFCAHLFFFLFGFFSVNEEDFSTKYFGTIEKFFPIAFLLNFVISTLLLVGWLVQMSKNNAFKHFYPSNALKLFGQFVQYFLIVFASISFFISFVMGEDVRFRCHYSSSYVASLKLQYPTIENKMDYDDPQLQEAYYVITNAENKIGVVKILGYLDIFMMIALFFSLIVFCVRVTNVRSFLFGIVFSHVLALLLAILSIITVFALGGNSVAWLYILTAYLMIFASVYLLGHISKLHSAILINFSLIVFVPASYSTLLLIEGRLLPRGLPNNYVILAATFVFIYFYSRVLHQWKAGAE